MATREEMHSLAQGIMGSYEARMEGIAGIRHETAAQRQAAQTALHDMHAAHQSMARQQQAALAQGRSDLVIAESGRSSQVQSWMSELASEHAGAREEWQHLQATMAARRGGVTRAAAPHMTAPSAPAHEAPKPKGKKRPSHGQRAGR